MRRLAACAILFASPFALLAANSSDGTPDTARSGDDSWGNSVRGLRLSIALSSNSMNEGSEIRYVRVHGELWCGDRLVPQL
jgi:hypothetical protein